MKYFVYSVLLLLSASCGGYRMLEGRSRPVYFTPDSTIFNDTLFNRHTIIYSDLLNLRGNFVNSVELKKGETSIAIIQEPGFFNGALIYPGEHLIVKGEHGNYTFSTAGNNHKRNKELLFFKTFYSLHKYSAFPFEPGASLETILSIEKQQKEKFEKAKIARRLLFEKFEKAKIVRRLLFDSLVKACEVSKKFKKLTKDYLENSYSGRLFYLYREKQYKDTLIAHDMYKEKCKQIINEFNGLTKRARLNNVTPVLNDIAQELFHYNVKIKNEIEFKTCFDSVENNFTGLARDYLLSQLMYRAYTYGILIPHAYLKKYKKYSIDKGYRKIVYRARSQQRRNTKNIIDSTANRLLAVNGKTIKTLEEVLAEHKGQLVLIDFWASWCVPCRKEMPYLKQVIQKYPADKITVLNVSVDREVQLWQKAVIASNGQENNNYLLLNPEKSSLMKNHSIETIPRYILFDKEGKIMNTEMPFPSDPAFGSLLDNLILE
jgi:thiol-disulfide isomerase/thioredoxin